MPTHPVKFRLDCVQKLLEAAFYRHGKFVSRHPLPFLLIPIIVSVGLTVGVIKLSEESDAEYLYSPVDGPSKPDRQLIQTIFPENDSYYFDASRQTLFDGYFNIIITNETLGGNIYTPSVMQQIIQLNSIVTSLTIDGKSYFDLCASWKGVCRQNTWLNLLNGTGSTIEQTNITYPVHDTKFFWGFQLGNVNVTQNGHIVAVEAVQMSYSLRYISSADAEVSLQWFHRAKDFLSTYRASGLVIDCAHGKTLDEELEKSVSGVVSKFAIAYAALMTFCVLSCMMFDWVRSKPWLAVGGEVAAGMAIVASLGLLSAAGVPFASTVGIMPFLIIGIGIDDMFVILSAWRHTSYTLPVEERMGLTFKTAAISITVTSVTDALAFLIGYVSNFRAVQLFCAYTGTAVIFSYIFAITFLAAILHYSGEREAQNKHAFTCKTAMPIDQASKENRSVFFKLFCTGGSHPEKHISHTELSTDKAHHQQLPWISEFIWKTLAPFIMKLPVKIVIMVTYCVYIAITIWGCLSLKEGLNIVNLTPDSSYAASFYNKQFPIFNAAFGLRVMAIYTDSLDYSNIEVQQEVLSQIDAFRNHPLYFSEISYTESWLHSYLLFLEMTSQPVPEDLPTFISVLRTQFLTQPGFDKFRLDIAFDANYTEITSSRFILQAKGTLNTLEERQLMLETRKMAAEAKHSMTVYAPLFVFIDQYTVIVSGTLQSMGIAVASMLVVAVILLPSLISAVWVTLCVVSICAGVIGFMVHWDVSLDSISMINLLMCIGFSVDFAAHISYHFCISKYKTGNEKAIDALGHLGTPVLQSAISTILGAVVLSTSDTYIFRTFFKIMVLVMLFGFAHAFFVLPVVLSWFGPQLCQGEENESAEEKTVVQYPNQNGMAHEVTLRNSTLHNEIGSDGIVKHQEVYQYPTESSQFNGFATRNSFQSAPHISKVYVIP